MPEGDKCDDLALPQTAKQAYVANIGRGYENNVKEAKNSPLLTNRIFFYLSYRLLLAR